MSRARRRTDEGSAIVEFLALGVVLLVPVVYLALVVGRVQAATYAADAAAREAARVLSVAPDEATGRAHAAAAVRLALLDQGFDVEPGAVTTVECSARPCLSPQGRVAVGVEVAVVLPGVPALLDGAVPARVTVRSSQVATVDAFRTVPVGAP